MDVVEEPVVATTRRPGLDRIVVATIVLLGAAVLLYPSTASWFSAVGLARVTDGYEQSVRQLQPADRAAALAEAEAYNADLASGAVVTDPFTDESPRTRRDEDPYWSLLDPDGSGLMGVVRIGAIDVDLPIYHGTAQDVLDEGVGHLRGTALPVGGKGTHAVITGHSGIATATLFGRLHEVGRGDLVELSVLSRTLYYRVTAIDTVLPDQVGTLRPVAGRDLLTLVTCTPIGINSHRLLVTAERTAPPPPGSSPEPRPVGPPWWLAVAVVVLAADAGYVFRRRRLRASSRPQADGSR